MFIQCHPERSAARHEADIQYLATCCLSRVRFEGAGSSYFWMISDLMKGALVALFALCTLWPAQAFAASELQKQMVRDMKKCGSTTEEVTCVVEGKDGWLFLQESLLNATKRWNDNTPQIIAFKDSLEARNIKLIVVPVPDKLLAVPELYSDKAKKGIKLPQYKKWVEKLRKHNVTVIDALDKIKELHKNLGTETPMFEPYESHCTVRTVRKPLHRPRKTRTRKNGRRFHRASPLRYEPQALPDARHHCRWHRKSLRLAPR